MDYNYECHQNFNFKLIKRALTPLIPSPIRPQLQINFNFFFEFNYCQWVLNEDSTALQFMGQINDPSIYDTSAHVTVHKSLSYVEVREAIKRVVSNMPLSDDGHNLLIELAWMEACKITYRPKTEWRCKILDLDFRLLVQHHHVFHSSQGISESCMVPAADSSVQSLKKYDINSGINTESCCCSICLEDFSDEGCEALCMPCSHVFHGDCIKKWLRTSHYCPLCRFKMPTD